jgi:hypothetical protein
MNRNQKRMAKDRWKSHLMKVHIRNPLFQGVWSSMTRYRHRFRQEPVDAIATHH